MKKSFKRINILVFRNWDREQTETTTTTTKRRRWRGQWRVQRNLVDITWKLKEIVNTKKNNLKIIKQFKMTLWV